MPASSEKSNKYFTCFLLSLLAAFIFYLAHPNPIIKTGISIFGFLLYLPVLFIVSKADFKTVWFFGGLYGSLSYFLYAFWLHNFNSWGLFLACFSYFYIMAVLFILLKVIDKLFLKNAWIVQALMISAYEYLKTLGFLGFSYGVTAYTQWQNIYLIQICDVIGVFGLNFFIIFPSALLYSYICKREKRKFLINANQFDLGSDKLSNISQFTQKEKALKLTDLKSTIIWSIIFLCFLLAFYIYGFKDIKSEKNYDKVKVLAVQNNEDPWKNGIDEYAKNIQNSKDLTEEAFELNHDIDFVVWSETSVVPSILYHYYKVIDTRRFNLVYSLLNYIENKEAIFVIGNGHEEDSEEGKKLYNSVQVYVPGKNVIPPDPDLYYKMHLVPLSESFPYKKQFPLIYKFLSSGNNHLWESGSDYKVFDYKGLKFSTPICFEDTFGDDCRNYVKNGARCFFNLSNDGWSKSRACQYQHLAISIFRAVENKVPLVRSTASGETCIIDQNGRIKVQASDFCKSYVVGEVDILDSDFEPSIYTKYGDICGKAELLLLALILIIQLLNVIIQKIRKIKNN
ncbi:MAG: apolipoprotein N-acyltransferase [Treponema sp.]|nr:apolipoprotein N-acyltransferase [Treponema sp.]